MQIKRVNDPRLPKLFWGIIEPDTAKFILEQPFEGNGLVQQRDVTKGAVNYYASEMNEGRWMAEECSPIKLTENLSVVDGQHRLRAVLQSNASITSAIALGVPSKAAIPDSVNPKAISHILKMAGEKNCSTLAGVLRFQWHREEFGWRIVYTRSSAAVGTKSSKMSTTMVLPFLEQHPTIREDVRWARSRIRSFAPMGFSAIPLAFLAYVTRNLDADLSGEFLAKFAHGSAMETDHAILQTRNCLLKMKDQLTRAGTGQANQSIVLATAIQAWNWFVLGTAPKNVKPYNPARQKGWPEPVSPETMT